MNNYIFFEGTNEPAYERIYAYPKHPEKRNRSWETCRGCDGTGILYLRADTATPNDQVVEMMREAYREGFNNADRRMVTIETESNAIDSIRSRYAASNGN